MPLTIEPLEMLLRLALAVVLGGAIGLERELTDKPVGFRSNTLICLGAALFTMFSLGLSADRGDPARVAAQVVTGIGFLGAGSILRRGERLQGITTAATIWLVAALGMGAGAGFYVVAVAGAAVALLVLGGFRWLERSIERRFDTRIYRISLRDREDESALVAVREVVHAAGLRMTRSVHGVTDGRRFEEVRLVGNSVLHAGLQERLVSMPAVFDLKVH